MIAARDDGRAEPGQRQLKGISEITGCKRICSVTENRENKATLTYERSLARQAFSQAGLLERALKAQLTKQPSLLGKGSP